MLNFVNPLFAWLAFAASIPLIIHLLNRRRYQQVHWAAMEFLLKALHKNRRRLRMESLILLLLRMLIVTILAFVLARPYLKGSALFKKGRVNEALECYKKSLGLDPNNKTATRGIELCNEYFAKSIKK